MLHATDLVSGKQVVLKFVESADRAACERRVLQMLNAESPDTAPTLYNSFLCDAPGPHQGRHALVLEAADSPSTVSSVVRRRTHGCKILQRRTDARTLLQCINALHEAGLVHCDIKAEHFLRFEGFWRLLDYGSVTEAGKRTGQPTYTMPSRAASPLGRVTAPSTRHSSPCHSE